IIGFGLGITIGDVNDDGWQDIFISNDFFEKDYLYINNRNGTFTESLENSMRSISAASMGADMADINNDLKPDIFVTDMLPEPLERIKQVTTFESWDKFKLKQDNGYYNQFSRNMLHMNNGDGTFSELGRMAGIEATDWSWSALIFDMDNDGLKDLFIANGIYQDITDLDYLNFIADDETKRKLVSREGVDYKAMTDPIPVQPVANYAYKNLGELKFENKAEQWGLGTPGHSNGAAYGDLDNDGDLDLVVNNVNQNVNVFINKTEEVFPDRKFIKVILEAEKGSAVGAKVYLKFGEQEIYQELMPTRGFQSTVDDRLNFGVGEAILVDEIRVVWPSGRENVMAGVVPDRTVIIKEEQAVPKRREPSTTGRADQSPLLRKISLTGDELSHKENLFLDYNRDRLLYHRRSTEGPGFAVGDFNNDGADDVFIGGAKGFPGKLLTWKNNGFVLSQELENEKKSEDTDAVFADLNGDGHIDLLVSSGGNEFGMGDPPLSNRLYLNNGYGKFSLSSDSGFGSEKKSTSSVAIADVDGDGDKDVFFGERLKPFLFGVPCDGSIWINDGAGKFTDMTEKLAPELKELGLITDGQWADIDGDNDPDLIVAGEWMEIKVFRNEGGKLTLSNQKSLANKKGWWNRMTVSDIDKDGDLDIIAGNHGLNTRFKASVENPLTMFVNDFDQNGSVEHIFCRKQDSVYYPITLKHELVAQMPGLKKKYLKYSSYNKKSLSEIFTPQQLEKAITWEINYLQSGILYNDGNGNFDIKPLPWNAQVSPLFGILVKDVDSDGRHDILLGGNLSGVKPEMGQYDASYGQILLGQGGQNYELAASSDSGFVLTGDVRHILAVNTGDNKELILVIKNDDKADVYEINTNLQ
ncbi:MAG: VCBS repeat-containing protein, partial [Cyclobacteriaceae bacterium]